MSETFTHPEQALAPIPELGETLKVINRGRSTLRFMWNSRVYVIPPAGGEQYMPFDAVKLYCGDPRCTSAVRTIRDSIGIVSFLPDRATEVRRLRLLYMAPFGEYMSAEDVGGIFDDRADKVETPGQFEAFQNVRIPQVEVYNIQGQRVITLLDDPEGDLQNPILQQQQQIVARDDVYQQRISHLEGMIDILSKRLGVDPHTAALDNVPDFLGEVDPDADESIETHDDGTPEMVYDVQVDSIRPKRKPRTTDPSTFDDLPEDKV
jgi:hypothetical protein